ncbi:MAG: anthranilate phosphoribosyltransferase [Rhodothermales bacterium]
MNDILTAVAAGDRLSKAQAEQAMHHLMRGEAGPEQIAGFLLGLRARGESLDELAAFTRVMREYAVRVESPDPDAIDLCGTGGDRSGTFNISTTAAFVCAGAGVTVAKHGNRSISSQCGSADVLKALGVDIELGKEGVEYCLREAGIAFIFAPYFHPALKHVMPVRRALGVRTFFNILGPLCNPAGVRRQLVGAFSRDVAETMAAILGRLGAQHVVAVHADDGLDEFSTAATASVFEVRSAAPPSLSRISASDFGLGEASLNAVRGGSAEENAGILTRVLEGTAGPHRDIVLLNAAFALSTSGRYPTVDDALEAARQSLDSGAAMRALDALREVSAQAPKREVA